MKILLIAYYFPPISSGGSSRPVKMAKYLSRFGHTVNVLTQSYKRDDFANSKTLRVYDISHNMERKGLNFFKWLILRLYIEVLNLLGSAGSIYDFWKKRAKKYADRIVSITRPDIIMVTYPPIETLELGLYFKERYNIPIIADFRDGLIFEAIEEKRISKYSCIKKHYESIEQKTATGAFAITTVSPQISKYFENKYGCNTVSTITNGYDPDDFLDIPRPEWMKRSKVNILYTGRFSLAESQRDISYFFEGVQKLVRDNTELKNKFMVHLVGEFTRKEKKELQDLIKSKIVRLHALVEKNVALSFQNHADLLLLFTSPNRTYMAPGKLYEYLYSQTPILALTSETFAEDIVKKTGSGWVIHPRDVEKIMDFLNGFILQPELSQKRDIKIEKIEAFSYKRQMENLNKILKLQKH